jgi:hypothetical protein
MKWNGYTEKGEARMRKLFSGKGLTYLMTIATLGLLLGANMKWHG